MSNLRSTRPPVRRDAARSRQAILDAAERLFAERGYEEGGRFLQGLPEHVASLGDAMPRLISQQQGGRLRDGVDPAHLLLSAISLCWFPMVAVALTRDLGFQADSPQFIEARKQQVSELLLRGAFQ
jgi:hypothetical protein